MQNYTNTKTVSETPMTIYFIWNLSNITHIYYALDLLRPYSDIFNLKRFSLQYTIQHDEIKNILVMDLAIYVCRQSQSNSHRIYKLKLFQLHVYRNQNSCQPIEVTRRNCRMINVSTVYNICRSIPSSMTISLIINGNSLSKLD